MILAFIFAQATMQTLAPGIPQAVPPTAWNCNFQAADGSKFTVAGTTPLFPAGSDPNASKTASVQSTHREAFLKPVGVYPREAGDWFREFQVSSGYPGVPQYMLNLMLRREGASIAYVTRFLSDGRQVPYEYHAVGLCSANFAPLSGGEKGQP